MSESQYWQLVRNLVEAGNEAGLPKHEIREDIVHQVHTAHAAGEHWAAEVLTRWGSAGADADYTRVFKNRNSVTYITADGRRVRKTVAYSLPQRSVESGQVIGRQLQAWWEMSPAAVGLLRDEIAQQGDRLADLLVALDLLLAAIARHPKAKTVGEAWLADGRSVDEIDLALPEAA